MKKIKIRNRKFSTKEIKFIINLRKKKTSIKKIGEFFGCSHGPITILLKKFGFCTKDIRICGKDIEKYVVRLYKTNKYTRDEICKKVGIGWTKYLSILNKNNLVFHSIDDRNIFNYVDTSEKAYVLGLLYTDGCNHYDLDTECYRFDIALHRQDSDLLNKVKKILKINNPLTKAGENCFCLSASSKQICEDLIKLGCYPKKSLIIKFPTENQVPRKFLPDFIRGVTDGDGYVAFINKDIKKSTCRIVIASGSPSFLFSLQWHLYYLYDISSSVYLGKKGTEKENSNRLEIFRRDDILQYYNLFYKNANVYMKRKRDRLIKFQKDKNRFNKFRPVYKTIDNIKYKRCYRCKKYKAPNDFHNCKSKWDGKTCECKKCCVIS